MKLFWNKNFTKNIALNALNFRKILFSRYLELFYLIFYNQLIYLI